MRDEHISDRSDGKPDHRADASDKKSESRPRDADDANTAAEDLEPPRTTTDGWLTTPKFGAAGSGGAELEPGPKRD